MDRWLENKKRFQKCNVLSSVVNNTIKEYSIFLFLEHANFACKWHSALLQKFAKVKFVVCGSQAIISDKNVDVLSQKNEMCIFSPH